MLTALVTIIIIQKILNSKSFGNILLPVLNEYDKNILEQIRQALLPKTCKKLL